MDLIRSISWVSSSHLRLVRDDDSYIDRLSHRYTVAICVLFAIIVSTKQYAGDPIDCWVPAQFKSSYEKYADSYCWIAGSWYTPMDKELPLNERERRSQRIRYYQWVPFLLLFQAILCYLPRVIWRSFNVKSGLDLVNLVDAAIKYESVDKFTDREKIMAYIVRNIERYIGARKSRYERLYGRQLCYAHNEQPTINDKNNCCSGFCTKLKIVFSTLCPWTGKRLGNYLVVLYMFVKTLWLTNAVSQLFLLNRFIGNDYHAFGLEIIEMLLSGQEWHEMRHFPRVTYCDFKIREIGNNHDWTVQCVLRINLFNEVIYIFMWFWLCILALCSLVDYFSWTIRILVPVDKLNFIKRHLDIYNYYLPSSNHQQQQHTSANNQIPDPLEYIDIDKEKKQMKEFTFKYLKDDGIFAMRLMATNTSDLIVTEIISELWKNYKNNLSNLDSIVDQNNVLLSQSSSTSTTTSQASSPLSSPFNQNPGTLTRKQQNTSAGAAATTLESNISRPHSPSNKKPFNNGTKLEYTQQPIYSNSAVVSSQKHNNQQQPPPPPTTIMPSLNLNYNNQNHSSDDSNQIKKQHQLPPSNLFPQIQHHRINHEHHSNLNPNAKDTML